jgi:hypothetical protein
MIIPQPARRLLRFSYECNFDWGLFARCGALAWDRLTQRRNYAQGPRLTAIRY